MKFCHQDASRKQIHDAGVDMNLDHLGKCFFPAFPCWMDTYVRAVIADIQKGFWIVEGCSVVDFQAV